MAAFEGVDKRFEAIPFLPAVVLRWVRFDPVLEGMTANILGGEVGASRHINASHYRIVVLFKRWMEVAETARRLPRRLG
jgi:hypothetical protein